MENEKKGSINIDYKNKKEPNIFLIIFFYNKGYSLSNHANEDWIVRIFISFVKNILTIKKIVDIIVAK